MQLGPKAKEEAMSVKAINAIGIEAEKSG